MWMNESEIRTAVQRITEPPKLVRGARFLSEFCDLINSISDGWPYWSYGTKCSSDLQTLVDKGQWPANHPPWDSIEPAIKKVLRFMARCKQTKDNEQVKAFIARWK